MQNVLNIDTAIQVAIITGVFAVVGYVVKEYFEHKRSKQVQQNEQLQKIMHLWGKIDALLADEKFGSATYIKKYNDELKALKYDPALMGWMIGHLEVLLERAKAARDEISELEHEGKILDIQKRQYKQYYLDLFVKYQEHRQKMIDLGKDVPDIPSWMYEIAEKAMED